MRAVQSQEMCGFSYWQKRIARNVLILVAALLCGGLFWGLFSAGRDFISHLSIASAYVALFLLAAALLLGPWNVWRGNANPVSFDLRRDIGIWAGIMAVVHTVVGLDVHLRGRPWLYFVNEHHTIRCDLFGFSNDTGALAALLIVMLLAISNDLSLRRLGSRKWKFLQQWTYAAALFMFAHAVGYQSIEKRQVSYEVTLWVTIALICALQINGWWIRAHGRARARVL